MSVRRILAVALFFAFVSSGCTRGKTEEEKAAARTAAARKALHVPEGLDAYWRDGVLPPGIEDGTPVPGGTMVVRINTEPPSLSNLIDSDGWITRITAHNLYEALVRPDPRDHPTYHYIPELATSWEVSEDQRTLTFQLRRGVQWHDGKPFTSKDVKFTYDRILDPLVRAAHHRQALEDLDRVETPDDFTVIFHWKNPYVWALQKVGDVSIVPAHAFEGHEGAKFNNAPYMRAPIGTGPFKFVSWEDQKAITFERFEGYWGKKAHVDRVVYRTISEPNVALQLMMRGEIDLDMTLQSEQYVNAAWDPNLVENFHRLTYFESQFAWVGWNNQRPVFRDPKVRRALAMLFERDKINLALYANLNQPAHCVFYHLGPNCDPETRQPSFDPAAAATLLEEAGWRDSDGDGVLDREGVPFRFTITIPSGNPVNEQMLLVYQQQLYRLGIEMDIQKVEWSIYAAKLRNHEFDACMLAWISSTPETDPYQVWHSSQAAGGSNYVAFQDPDVDALVEQIRGTFDEEERQALFRSLNARIIRDQPLMPIFHQPRRTLLHRRVKGVYLSPMQFFQVRDFWIDPSWGNPS